MSYKSLLLSCVGTSVLLFSEEPKKNPAQFILTNEETFFQSDHPRHFVTALDQASPMPGDEAKKESSPSTWNCQNIARPNFVSLGHREGKGIGYTRGYSSADLFLSYTTERLFTPFLDLRSHYFWQDKWASNAGFGMREASNSLGVVIGINVFYDYRQARHAHFNQVGAGLEVLGEHWDVRVNGYIPVSKRRKTFSERYSVASDGTTYRTTKTEYDFVGGDIEIGRVMLKWKTIHAKITGGAYYLSGLFGKEAIGGLLRISGQLSPFIGFEGQGSYDPHFKWIAQGQLSLVFPFWHRLYDLKKGGCPNAAYNIEERFLEPVSRFEIIATDVHKRKKRVRSE